MESSSSLSSSVTLSTQNDNFVWDIVVPNSNTTFDRVSLAGKTQVHIFLAWFRAISSEDVPLRLLSPMQIKEGFLGEGRVVPFPNMKTTSDMVGRSVAHSCMQSSAIWMHLETSSAGYDSLSDESTIPSACPSLHISQI